MTVVNDTSSLALPVKAADADIAAFLYHESRLLDERRYDDWADLFAEDGLYWIPCNDRDIDPARHVSIVYDDVEALRGRIDRLNTGKQYAQDPPSQICRAVSNVHLDATANHGEDVVVYSTLLAVEARRQHTKHVFGASCTHRLRRVGGGLRIVLKRVDLVDSNQFFENLTFLL